MNAHLIISTEYKANRPSVFILTENGDYFGDLNYPFIRNLPKNVDYWMTATCADSDRFFKVQEVIYTSEQMKEITELHAYITMKTATLKDMPGWIPAPKASKRSKEYKEYLAQKVENERLESEAIMHNDPITSEINAAFRKLETILLSVE